MKKLFMLLTTKFIVYIIAGVLFLTAFIFDSIENIYFGYLAILQSPSVLISDYLHIGGLGATMFNVASIMLLNLFMLQKLNIKMTGPVFAGLLTIAGFSFFGKNLFNTLPIYLGIYLYARTQKLPFGSFIIVILFSTGISPIVSFLLFGTEWPLFIGILAGVIVGIFTGFVLPPLATNTLRFHRGYNLYNIGFAMGVLSMLYAAILRSFDINLDLGGPSSYIYHTELMIITILLSSIFISFAFIKDKSVLKNYPTLLKRSGRSVSDFLKDHGKAVTMLNVGIMGLVALTLLLVLNLKISGAVMGGILTVMGFGAFGKHPRNAIPVMVGAYLGVLLTNYTLDSVGIVIALLFVTAVSPIAGKYGIIVGIVAGFIHILITPLSYAFQGGFDLYNNGFAAGFVAALMVPVLEIILKDKKEVLDNA
ncbi:MAG: DUF1576 domain-containing protein [Bacillota bacterium]